MVYVFLAPGFEVVEAMTPVDILKRAKVPVTTVSITDDLLVESSNGTKLFADTTIDKIDFDAGEMLVLPGGMPGSDNLAACKKLTDKIVEYNEAGKMLAAICAAPYVLGINNVLVDKGATCFPGFEDKLIGATFIDKKVVFSKNVITARGMGASVEFGLALVMHFKGEEVAKELADKIRFY